MKRNKGFTLLELQISSLVMVVVLIATGVIFYFALSSIRYLHDGFSVYTNATTAMKLITQEVMISNCYGSEQGPGYVADLNSFYDPANGYIHEGPDVSNNSAGDVYNDMPSLGGIIDMVVTGESMGTGLFLRQATQSSSVRGVVGDSAGDFPRHEIVEIYRSNTIEPGKIKLVISRTGAMDQIIADNVTRFDFQPIAYNMLHVFLTVEGRVPDPLSGLVRSITLSKAITLRCAPSVTPIPDGDSW